MSDFGVSQANSQGQSLISETIAYNQQAKAHNDQILRDYQGQKKQLATDEKEDKYFHLATDGYSLYGLHSQLKQSYNIYKNGVQGAKQLKPSTDIQDFVKSKIQGAPKPEGTPPIAQTGVNKATEGAGANVPPKSQEPSTKVSSGKSLASDTEEALNKTKNLVKPGGQEMKEGLEGAFGKASKFAGTAGTALGVIGGIQTAYGDLKGDWGKEDTAGKVSNVASIASGVLDVAAMIPGLAPIASPLGALSGLVGAISGGIESRNQDDKEASQDASEAQSQKMSLQSAPVFSQMGMVAS
ncbi:MAG TPA: hypothetical protein VMZ91_05115, partial [Candidatus Paceibacterota bacterium]|nr:hypothetical protein [Candidatus Paceibacterota bacterium]